MANRTFLIRTQANALAQLDPLHWKNDDYLATATEIVPVFWLALFDAASILERTTTDEHGRPFSYPVLFDDAHAAVERAARRARTIFTVLPAAQRELYNVFLNYVALNARDHIYVEDLELSTPGSTAAYTALLRGCFAAFAPDADARAWAAILGQARISDVRTIEPAKLAGSRWTRAVPWPSGD